MSISTPEQYRRRSVHPVSDVLITEQSHAEECDIHTIMRKFQKQGVIDHVSRRGPEYANYVNAPDFKQAMDFIANAKSLFMDVPSHIREKFDNDPAKYLEYMTDPENREAIVSMGLPVDHLPEVPATPVAGQEKSPEAPPQEATEASPPADGQ